MVLMMTLPSAPWAYSVRTAVTLALLVVTALRRGQETAAPVSGAVSTGDAASSPLRRIAWGVVVGLLVLVIWIAPDRLSWYREFCVVGDPYADAKALALDSPFTWLQLFGSAFVISAAEELFFRKWLIC